VLGPGHPGPQDQLVDHDPGDPDGGEPDQRGQPFPLLASPDRRSAGTRASAGRPLVRSGGRLGRVGRVLDDRLGKRGPDSPRALLVPQMLIQQRTPPCTCNSI
jgi:hypothetical protein